MKSFYATPKADGCNDRKDFFMNNILVKSVSLFFLLGVVCNSHAAVTEFEITGTYQCRNILAQVNDPNVIDLNTESSISKLVVTSNDMGEYDVQIGDEVSLESIGVSSLVYSGDDVMKLTSFGIDELLMRDINITFFLNKKSEMKAFIESTFITQPSNDHAPRSFRTQLDCVQK